MRMNFFGLHSYPFNYGGAEPTVWIGQTDDMDAHTGEVSDKLHCLLVCCEFTYVAPEIHLWVPDVLDLCA